MSKKILTSFLFLLQVLCIPAGMSAQEISAADVEGLISRWVGLERQKDELNNNWREQQPILQQQLYLLEQEQDELNELLKSTENLQDEVEAKRLQLLEEQSLMEQQQQALEQSLNRSIIELERIYKQLPPPMHDAWQDSISKLQGDLLSNSERLQLVVEMLGQLNDFQQKITLHESKMQLDDGEQYLVRQVYLGPSHGWYITADGIRAGSGTATPLGWVWQSGADSETVARFIAILERRHAAELLTIPIVLTNFKQAD